MRHKTSWYALAAAAGLLLAGCARSAPDPDSATSPEPAAEESVWPAVDSNLIDPAIEARIDEIMAKMTLEQKVGQVIQADNGSVTPEDVKTYRLGSVLSGGNSAPNGKPYASVEEWVAATDAFYAASVDPEGVEIAIPIIWGIDAVHGHNNVIGGTVFPHNIGLGAARNPELIEKIAEVTATELRVTGHDWTFAPTVAVPRDDRWGRTYEGFAEDPEVVASYSAAIVEGLQGEFGADDFLDETHVISTAKHYLGDGGTQGGQDQGDTKVSEAELARIHGAGYPPAIEAGALSIMATFSSWNGTKTTGDKYLLTDVLKDRMGFDGFIVSDWNAHGQIDGCTNEDCPEALIAGIDMYMAPDSWKGLYENTLAQVKSGEIPMARLDDAVRRVLRAKLHYGLFDEGRPSERPLAGRTDLLGSPEHRAVARQAVRESLVLLKNDGILPIAPTANIMVAGDGADSISKQSGGWTLTWQGGGIDNEEFPNGASILDGLSEAANNVTHSPDGSYDEKPDVAIIVFGEDPYAEFRGDVDHLAYDAAGSTEIELLRKLQADGIPTVSVFLSGRPMWVNPELNASDAFVAAWLPGSEGTGVADVLVAAEDGSPRYDFTGKLSYSWPKRPDQGPLNVGDETYDPLFAYGYGLSYAEPGEVATLDETVPDTLQASGNTNVYFANGSYSANMRIFKSGTVSESRVDHRAQEDAISLTFGDTGGWVSFTDGSVSDLVRESNADIELLLTLRSTLTSPVSIGMACEGEDCRSSRELSPADLGNGDWTDVRISLSCFSDIDLTSIIAPIYVEASGPGELAISEARLVEDADAAETCPGD